MNFYVIYTANAKAARIHYIVRKWVGKTPENDPIGRARTLRAARTLLPYGLKKLAPLKDDDPAIREVWV